MRVQCQWGISLCAWRRQRLELPNKIIEFQDDTVMSLREGWKNMYSDGISMQILDTQTANKKPANRRPNSAEILAVFSACL